MKIAAILVLPSLVVTAFYVMSVMPAPSAAATTVEIASPASESSPDTTISIHDFMFSPMSVTVTAGTTVHWKNLDPEPHTVRSVDATFRSDPLDQNDTFAFKFNKPGTYRYVCSIHPQMLGTIIVKDPT